MTPAIRFFEVQGNAAAFREHTWMRDGWNGGYITFDGNDISVPAGGSEAEFGPYCLADGEYIFAKNNILKEKSILMNVFVLLYNSGTDKEGIHSIELKGRTIVLMFEDKDDATRYCGLLEAQDFPLPTVEMINIEEIKDFCIKLDYECKLVEKNFVPKTAEDRLLISPPQKNLEVENWEEDKNSNKDSIDINTIKENLEKLL